MVFGFNVGSSKTSSTSTSQSQSDAYGYSNSFSDSVSGGKSLTGSQSTTGQTIAYGGVYDQIYDDVLSRVSGIDPSILTGQANRLFMSGGQFLDTLGGGADTDYLTSRVDGSSPVLDEQIGALGADLGRFFREELNPAITSRHVAAGTLGSGRQGVAQGKAMDSVAREFQRGATELRAKDIAARDSAAATLGQQRIAGATAGLSAIPGLLDTAQTGQNAALAPLLAVIQAIGGPQALTNSQSTSFGTSEDFARAFSEAAAEDWSTSSSSSSSTSKGKSFNFGIGGLGK